jgi:hypothetical protein
MKPGSADLLAWLNPDTTSNSPVALKDALFGGGSLSHAIISSVTFLIMVTSLVVALAGSHLGSEGIIIKVASSFERPLVGVLVISLAILVLLCATVWAVVASAGSFVAVVAALLVSVCALYEVGSLVRDTALYYVAPIVLGAVAINSILLPLTGAKSEDTTCMLASFASTSIAVYFDISNASIVFDRASEMMLNVARVGIFFIPFLFGVVASLAIGRWNLEQAKNGVSLVKASIPAVVCAVFVAGLVFAIVIFSALRKLFRVGFSRTEKN